MKYLDDKRRRLGGQELKRPGQVQNPASAQEQTTPSPKAVQTTAQQPQVQTQAAAPKAMEKQTQTQAAPTTQPATPVQTTGQDAVTAAQNLLNQQLGSYQSQYGGQIDSLIQQLQGQQPFAYDVNTDPLYLQLRDQWMRDGKLAMEDTMGQAAQLTGGYGNSHAQTAGQQVYNGYMRGLNEMVPQLKEAARADYDAENAYLMQQLGLLMDQDNQDYSRWMDELQRQQYAEQLEYDRGRDALADQRYQDELAYGRGQDAYDRLLEMIVTTGYKPTAEELAAAGMTEAQAKAWLSYYRGAAGGGSRGSGGGGGGGGPMVVDDGGPGPVGPDAAAIVNGTIAGALAGATIKDSAGALELPKDYAGVAEHCRIASANGAPASEIAAALKEYLTDGVITKEQCNELIRKYGNPNDTVRDIDKSQGGAGGGGNTEKNRYNRFN